MNIRFKFLFIFLSLLQYSYAQDYTIDVQQIGVEDGLLHRHVNDVYEDTDGLIWVNLEQGIQRYDGYNFKTWTNNDSKKLKFPLHLIGQDEEGWLWFQGSKSYLVFLHTKTEEILTVEERFGDTFPIKQDYDSGDKYRNKQNWSFNSGIVTLQNQIIIPTRDGQLFTFDSKNGFQIESIAKERNLFTEYNTQQNTLYLFIDEDKTFYKKNEKGELQEVYKNNEDEITLNYFQKNGKTYFFSIKNSSTNLRDYALKEIDNNGNTRIIKKATSGKFLNGLLWAKKRKTKDWEIFDSLEQPPVHTIKRSDHNISLYESVRLYVDSQERVWIYGIYGLNKVELRPKKFHKHFSYESEIQKPFNNSTRGIWVNQDYIFANFEKSYSIKIDKNEPDNWSILSKEIEPRPILKNKDGTYWIGNIKSIQKINADGKLIQKILPKTGVKYGIWSLYKDRKERIWVGSSNLLRYKNKDENILYDFKPKNDPTGFAQRRMTIQNMLPTHDNKVWFCASGGLYLFDPINEIILERYAEDEEEEHFLPASFFYYLHEDQEGIRWIGTSDGLIRWNPTASEEERIKLFTRKDGLSNNVIYAIFEDKHNKLWMSSDYGIMSFDKTTFDVKSYLEKDGISHFEFNRTAQFQTKDGTIYFGGLNGITSFHPNDFVEEARDYAKMFISDFEIFDGEKESPVNRVADLRTTKTINFYPSDRFFRLKFVLPTFEDVDKVLYGWKIDGVSSDWNYQKENTLQFGALPYGSHILQIKGQSSGGSWSPHELSITVNVYKPFYLQFWFITLCVLSLMVGIFLLYKRRTYKLLEQRKLLETEIQKATQQIQEDKATIEADKKTIELQAEELKELDKLKSRFFANVSHELRTPLTLMLGPISSAIKNGELSNRDFTLLKTAQQNGKDLLKLIAAILDLSKMESGKMELEEAPELLFPLVRRIASNFESHAQRGGVQFNFEYEAEKDLQIEVDKSKLEVIINNLLSNAVKFTPAGGKISIAVEDLNNKIKFMITDTGRGIHPNDLPHVFDRFYQSKQPDAPTEGGTGIGLALSQEFVKMMDGKIWVESEVNKGSIFIFEIPRKEILGMVEATEFTPKEKIKEAETTSLIHEEKAFDKSDQPTILVAEDNHTLRQYLETILSTRYNVLTAENGKAAFQILTQEKTKPQLIISDIMMPIMDGFQLLNTVKKDEALSHLPMIMLTARADIQDKLKALRIGVDDYLIKPFEEEELIVRIENLLRNYRERKSEILQETEKSKTPIISREDQKWLEELEKTLIKELSNSQYSMPQLADDLAISERQLRRRIKKLIGLTPAQYFKEIRLHQAREHLENKKFKTIAQTAAANGFHDVGTFSKNFFKHFGKKPSEYINS